MPTPSYAFLAQPTAGRIDILAAQVHRILSGGTPTADSPYDRREIKLACEQALASIQGEIDRLNTERVYKDAVDRMAFDKARYFENMDAIYKYGGTGDDHIVTLTDWPVSYDAAQGLSYSLLPESYLNVKRYQNLPGEEQVRSVEPMLWGQRQKRRYIPLAAGQERLVAGLEGNFGFYRKGVRLYYYTPPGVAMPDKVVKIEFTLRPLADGLPSPGLLQAAQDDMVIAKVVPALVRKVAEDKVNDNNATL